MPAACTCSERRDKEGSRRGGSWGVWPRCPAGQRLRCQSPLEAGAGALGSVRTSSSSAVVLSMCCMVVAGSCSEQMAVGVLVCSLTE